MSPSLLDDASFHLPLTVTTVGTDPDGVSVSGRDWRYRINTEWRIGPAGGWTLESLVGRQVVALAFEAHGDYADLLLTFDDGRTLTAVSDFPYGEWIFSIEANGTPVFDLSGPPGETP